MPISEGFHIPTLDNQAKKPTSFNLLLTGLNSDQITTLSINFKILHNYLDSINLNSHRFNLHIVTPHNFRTLNYDFITVIDDVFPNKESILDYAENRDIDVLLDELDVFSKNEIFTNRDRLLITGFYPKFREVVESVVSGWGIAWTFDEPRWNATWLSKYLSTGTLSKQVFDFMGAGQIQGYSSEQVHLIRNLSLKVTHINHSKHLLEYYILLRRYAKRHNHKEEDYNFEIIHHLNSYYLLMSSSMDVLARLLNSVYKLGYEKHNAYTLDNKDFLKKLKRKRKGLHKIINLKKHIEWMEWMRIRRNTLAHESNIFLSPMVMRKTSPLADTELDEMVEQSMDWNFMLRSGTTQSAIDSKKENVKWQIDLTENYDTVVSDSMQIEKTDLKTRITKQYLFFPLRVLDSDYSRFQQIIKRVVDNLTGAKKVK